VKLFKGLLVAGAAAAIPTMVAANAASAAPATVKAVTHLDDRADTCACVTNVSNDNGYVWAYDNMSRQFTVTPVTGQLNQYKVDIVDNGSFSAIAEPNNKDLTTAHPIKANGSVTGTQTYLVTSNDAPSASALPSHVGADVSTTNMIEHYLFANGTIISGDYTYTYRAGNQLYTQSSTADPQITGNITGK
jgi:hypothetical protein